MNSRMWSTVLTVTMSLTFGMSHSGGNFDLDRSARAFGYC